MTVVERTQGSSKLSVLAWPASSENPYVEQLYALITDLDEGVSVSDFNVFRSWRSTSDIVHVHWPEAAVGNPSFPYALARGAAVLANLWLQKRRGAQIVWTCHNLKAHDGAHPRLDRLFRNRFESLVDGVLHLTATSERSLEKQGRLRGVPSAVTPLLVNQLAVDRPVDRLEARRQLGLDEETPVLAFAGFIRPYKNVPALIRAFHGMIEPAHLLVAGRPANDEIRQQLREAAAGVERLHLDDRWLDDDELALRIAACDVVVLPYLDIHNSGAALLALGRDRPVVVNPKGSLADLVDQVGPDWAYPLQGPISGEVLDDVARWAAEPRSGKPDLSAFDQQATASKTVEFFKHLSASSTSVARLEAGRFSRWRRRG